MEKGGGRSQQLPMRVVRGCALPVCACSVGSPADKECGKECKYQTAYHSRPCLISSVNISILQVSLDLLTWKNVPVVKILLLSFKVARYFHHILVINKILIVCFDKTDKTFSNCFAFL